MQLIERHKEILNFIFVMMYWPDFASMEDRRELLDGGYVDADGIESPACFLSSEAEEEITRAV